jgi:hypothetical protein
MATKSKKKKNHFIDFLNMGCYPGCVCFCHGYSVDELYAILEKLYSTKKWELEMGIPIYLKALEGEGSVLKKGKYFALKRVLTHPKYGEKRCFFILIFDDFKFTDDEMCKLAHECLHICQFYLPDVLNRDQEIEAEAYLHTHLMSQCLKLLRG